MTNEIAIFASRHNVDVRDAYVLPALFDHIAQIAGMHRRAIVSHATYDNDALACYVVQCAREIACADREGRDTRRVKA